MNPSGMATSDEAGHEDHGTATSDEERKATLISSLEGSLVKVLDLSDFYCKWLTKDSDFRLRLASSIGRCQSLKKVQLWPGMTIPELELLCEGLCQNKVMETLDITDTRDLGDEGSKIVVKMLSENETLTHFYMCRSNVSAAGASSFEWMLAHNSTLKFLGLQGNPLCAEGVRALLRPLTAREGHQANTSLTRLHFSNNQMGAEGAAAVALMLRNNQTLSTLSICADDSIGEEDVCSIIESLKENKSLEELDLQGIEGARGSVFPAIMDLLQVNIWLQCIHLVLTPLARDGQDKAIKAQLARNAQAYNTLMRDMPRIRPTSARVFLCGHAYSGKTTLARSMPRSLATKLRKKLRNKIVEYFESQHANEVFTEDSMEWATRTRGIEIRVLVDDVDQKISIWDLAGQEEYHAFHDFMIPDLSTQGSPCSFLLLCNPFLRKGGEKPTNDIKKELSYWLRFIASNTRRSIKFQPNVAVVLTHCDTALDGIKHDELVDCVDDLKKDFASFINMSSKFYTVNARRSSKQVRELVEDLKVTCSSVLKNLPKVYEACQEMRDALLEWNRDHPDQPLITKEVFQSKLIQEKIPSLKKDSRFPIKKIEELVEGRCEAVFQSLHEVGEVIYFSTEEFVVVNPKWFCHEIMGHLINLNTHVDTTELESDFVNGFADMKYLERLLQRSLKLAVYHSGNGSTDLPTKSLVVYLIQLMFKLDLCYESHQASASDSKVFIPTTLMRDEHVARGERRLRWEIRDSNKANLVVIYLGRRLQCSERELTTLTPGFFPKLQVILHNHFKDSVFTNEKNLMRIIQDGMEILVELSGDIMEYLFIDIMVKSWRSQTETLEIVDDRVVREIQELCNSPQGCQGVVLVESILRPDCVQELVLCKYRCDKAVVVETLKKNFLATGLDPRYMHTWRKVEGPYELGASFEEATLLLGEKDTGNVLDRRIAELEKVESLVDSQLASSEPKLAYPQVPLQQVTSFGSLGTRIDILECTLMNKIHLTGDRVIHEVSKKVEDIKSKEKNLVEKIYKKLDAIINLSLQLQERQVPCNVYFTTKGTSQQWKLIIKLIPGYSVIQLHLLCEHQHGIHVVKNQEGLTVTLATKFAEKYIGPLIIGGLTIFNLLLKVGAHAAAGIGDMVPNIGKDIALALDTQSLSEYLSTFSDALDPLRVSGTVNEIDCT